jgi:hypothetical protein
MRRSFHPIRTTACALTLALLAALVLAGSASAAEPLPTIEPSPPNQTSTAGKAITPVVVTGTNLASLTPEGLPQGLVLERSVANPETEWTITGTPIAPKAATAITLEARNKEEVKEDTPGVRASFKWTVSGVEKPATHLATVGEPTTVLVKGVELHSLTANELPEVEGKWEVHEVPGSGESEWTITGTPTTPQTKTVMLEAKDRAGEEESHVSFKWKVEAAPAITTQPADQTSTAGRPITPLAITGTNLFELKAEELPAGLGLEKAGESEWRIIGTPVTPKAAVTVQLTAVNEAGGAMTRSVAFQWTVVAETPTKALETPAKPPETPPPPTTIPSAGRLGTLPVQKPGKSLTASFLCEVASCQVQVTATITAGKKKFKIHSARTPVAQGQKAKLALKLSKAQQALVAAALKKHKKVSAALAASISSSVGFQVTKALVIAVKR